MTNAGNADATQEYTEYLSNLPSHKANSTSTTGRPEMPANTRAGGSGSGKAAITKSEATP